MDLAAEVKVTEKQLEQVSLVACPICSPDLCFVMVTPLLPWLQYLHISCHGYRMQTVLMKRTTLSSFGNWSVTLPRYVWNVFVLSSTLLFCDFVVNSVVLLPSV